MSDEHWNLWQKGLITSCPESLQGIYFQLGFAEMVRGNLFDFTCPSNGLFIESGGYDTQKKTTPTPSKKTWNFYTPEN